jgi:hypothetical protein
MAPASTDTILTYTGNDFTTARGVLTTSDSVSITIDLSSPLAANMAFVPVTPVFWTMRAGPYTLSSSMSGLTSLAFDFATNASGTISGWFVRAETATSPTEGIASADNCPICMSPTFDKSGLCLDFLTDSGCSTLAVNNFDQGNWTAVPLQPSLPANLLSAGLLGLVFYQRRRKLQTPPAPTRPAGDG